MDGMHSLLQRAQPTRSIDSRRGTSRTHARVSEPEDDDTLCHMPGDGHGRGQEKARQRNPKDLPLCLPATLRFHSCTRLFVAQHMHQHPIGCLDRSVSACRPCSSEIMVGSERASVGPLELECRLAASSLLLLLLPSATPRARAGSGATSTTHHAPNYTSRHVTSRHVTTPYYSTPTRAGSRGKRLSLLPAIASVLPRHTACTPLLWPCDDVT